MSRTSFRVNPHSIEIYSNHIAVIFSSIKETNWLISNGVCVLLFDAFNGCSLVKKWVKECQTFTIEKN